MLLVVFNRPEVVAEMVDSLRLVRPRRLFVVADGPRRSIPADQQLCDRTRAVFDQIDWPCELTRRFRDDNLGLGASMVDAITWFFSHVDAGVILEDDCVAHPDFYAFAAELLERYRQQPQIMAISAVNLAPEVRFAPYSYCYASAGNIWAWATWRRAWEGYDPDISDWPERRAAFLDGASPLQRTLATRFDAAYRRGRSTWARAWHYHLAVHAGLVVIPSANLVRNIGFGPNATHTRSRRHSLAGLVAGGLPRPYDAPLTMTPHLAYERHLRRLHARSLRRRVRRGAKRLIRSVRG